MAELSSTCPVPFDYYLMAVLRGERVPDPTSLAVGDWIAYVPFQGTFSPDTYTSSEIRFGAVANARVAVGHKVIDWYDVDGQYRGNEEYKNDPAYAYCNPLIHCLFIGQIP